jgi:hypothetical protein
MITVEEAIKKNLLHKGKKSHFIYMKEKQALYVWISQPCRVVNRDPNKIRVKQFNKLLIQKTNFAACIASVFLKDCCQVPPLQLPQTSNNCTWTQIPFSCLIKSNTKHD